LGFLRWIGFCLITLAVSTVNANAQIKISGYLPKQEQAELRFFVFEEFLTNREIMIGETRSNDSGFFESELQVRNIQPLLIKTENSRAILIAEPGENYRIRLSKPDTVFERIISIEPSVAISFLDADSASLNIELLQFEKLMDDFYRNHAIYFVQPRLLQPYFEEFRKLIKDKFKDSRHDWLHTHIRYSMASLEEAVYQNKAQLFRKYFKGPVDYRHPAYFVYFQQYFKQHLRLLSNKISGEGILTAINGINHYPSLDEQAKLADTLLTNDTLRQLVIISGLREMYYLPDIDRMGIERILRYLGTHGLGPNKTMAMNVLNTLTYVVAGEAVKSYQLPDFSGKEHRLDDERGKIVYIAFGAEWNKDYMNELVVMQRLNQKYGHRVSFISILVDGDAEKLRNHVVQKKYNWKFLNDTAQKRTRELYQIKTLPHYMIIDHDGELLRYIAPAPSDNLEFYLKQLIRRK
jgi:hypothetical protein